MATVGKKKMKAVLKVKTTKELHKKVQAWVNTDPGLKKLFSGYIEYSEDIELDPRKWNPGTLSKALFALIRYELKLLDMSASEIMKDWEKADDKKKKDLVKRMTKSYNDLVKQMQDKCSLALEEVAADKGDNKKGLRDGKAALKRLSDVNVDKVFSTPRTIVMNALMKLDADLDDAEDMLSDEENAKRYNDGKALREKAIKTAQKLIVGASTVFDGDGKDAGAAVAYLTKTAIDIKNNKEANAKLKEFGLMIEKCSKDLQRFTTNVVAFSKMLEDIKKSVADKNIRSAFVPGLVKNVDATKAWIKSGAKVQTDVQNLRKAFTKIEKELK